MTTPTRRPAGRWRARHAELAIFGLALVLRLGLFLAVGAWEPERLDRQIFVGDAREYHRIAVNLVEHGVYSSRRQPPLEPDTFRVPLYPWYLALFYRLFGPLPYLAILPQLALGALTCVVVCRTGAVLFDRRTGVVAGAIMAADYTSVLFSNRLYADTLFTLTVALAVYAVARHVARGDDPRRKRGPHGAGDLVAAGFWLALATLCRAVGLYFVVAMAPVLWLRWRRRPLTALGSFSLVAAVYVLTLLPWMVRNYGVDGRLYVTSIQASMAEWFVPAAIGDPGLDRDQALARAASEGVTRTPGRATAGEPTAAVPSRAAGPAVERRSWSGLRTDAIRFGRGFVRFFAILGSGEVPLILGIPYQHHDALALREASLGAWVRATLDHRSGGFARTVVVSILAYLLALYLAAARGLWLALRQRRWLALTLLLSTIGYFMVSTGPLSREVRYRLPALPAIVLFAGLGIGRSSRTSDRREALTAPAAARP